MKLKQRSSGPSPLVPPFASSPPSGGRRSSDHLPPPQNKDRSREADDSDDDVSPMFVAAGADSDLDSSAEDEAPPSLSTGAKPYLSEILAESPTSSEDEDDVPIVEELSCEKPSFPGSPAQASALASCPGSSPRLDGDKAPSATIADLLAADPGMNKELHIKLVQKLTTGAMGRPITYEHRTHLELLRLLNEARAPVYLFDEIVAWARRDAIQQSSIFSRSQLPISRSQLLTEVASYQGAEDFKPKLHDVWLPNAGVYLKVTAFDAGEAIFSLLSDDKLTRPENLEFFDESSIFAPPPGFDRKTPSRIPPDHVFGDVYSGRITRLAYHHKVKGRDDAFRGREMVIPIIMFVDKTHIDTHGRLCQEPVCFPLGCFNRKTRALPSAWRILGYVPNQSVHPTAKESVGRLDDYHCVLRCILKSLVDFQSKGPCHWEFPPCPGDGPGTSSGLFHFFFANLQGDIPGHDAATGHYNSRTSKVAHVCRRCDIPHQKLDDPLHTFQLLRKTQMLDYDIDPVTGKPNCNRWCYHKIENGNAFNELDMGIPPDHRLAHVTFRTAFDSQHTDRKGNMEAAVNIFRSLPKSADISKPKSWTEIPKKKGPPKDPPKVFSPMIKRVVERAMVIWGTLLQNQSDRGLPRTYFPQGSLSLTRSMLTSVPAWLSCAWFSSRPRLERCSLAPKDQSRKPTD